MRGSARRSLWRETSSSPSRPSWGRVREGHLPDFPLLFATLALLLLGLLMVASASLPLSLHFYDEPERLFLKQLLAAGIGLGLLGALMRGDYRRLQEYDGIFLLGALGATLLTFVPALAPNGLWLQIGGFSLQPTEFLKVAFLVYLAAALVRKERIGDLEDFTTGVLPFYALLGLISLIAALQPDFALVALFGAITGFMLFIAGVRLLYLGGPLLAGLPGIALLLWLAPYRRERLLSYLNPFADPEGAGYHVIQSWIALGSGGLWGRGLGASREKWLYLPSAYNDFIVSVIGEELGLLGVFLVLGLFVFLGVRGFRIALSAPDRFGFLLASGITFALAFQAAVNVSVAVGVLPVTGLTLPLVSYGGSSLIASLLMIGILLNISRYAVLTETERTPGEPYERPRHRWGNRRPPLPRVGAA